ncbi:MAG: NADH-quinone oxidoreductase subunit A [Bacteroidota bacterium]
MAIEQVAFLEILTFIAGAMLMVGIGSFVSSLLRPRRLNLAKTSTYESGEEAVGNSWGQFNARFYGMAIVFVLFEVETILLFPWATVWANSELNEATEGLWARYTAGSAVLFITLLAIGLIYAWSQGHLNGLSPSRPATSFVSKIPKTYYDGVNERYAVNSPQNTDSSKEPTI